MIQGQGTLYPTARHLLAEVQAVAVHVLQHAFEDVEVIADASRQNANDAGRKQILQYRQTVLSHVKAAEQVGYYRVGDRLDRFRNDPLFAAEEFQSVVPD